MCGGHWDTVCISRRRINELAIGCRIRKTDPLHIVHIEGVDLIAGIALVASAPNEQAVPTKIISSPTPLCHYATGLGISWRQGIGGNGIHIGVGDGLPFMHTHCC